MFEFVAEFCSPLASGCGIAYRERSVWSSRVKAQGPGTELRLVSRTQGSARRCQRCPSQRFASARSKMTAGSPVFGLSGKLTRFSHCLEHESIWVVCLERRVVYEWKPIVFLDPDNLHCDSPSKVKRVNCAFCIEERPPRLAVAGCNVGSH
jgi:hypothetical protein